MPAEITQPTGDLYRAVCTDCFWSGPALPVEHLAGQAMTIHNAVMHPLETGEEMEIAPEDDQRLRVIFTAANRWRPPSENRERMNIHPDVRKALRKFCNDTMAGTGVGYSEFIMNALIAHESGAWNMADMPAKSEADAA